MGKTHPHNFYSTVPSVAPKISDKNNIKSLQQPPIIRITVDCIEKAGFGHAFDPPPPQIIKFTFFFFFWFLLYSHLLIIFYRNSLLKHFKDVKSLAFQANDISPKNQNTTINFGLFLPFFLKYFCWKTKFFKKFRSVQQLELPLIIYTLEHIIAYGKVAKNVSKIEFSTIWVSETAISNLLPRSKRVEAFGRSIQNHTSRLISGFFCQFFLFWQINQQNSHGFFIPPNFGRCFCELPLLRYCLFRIHSPSIGYFCVLMMCFRFPVSGIVETLHTFRPLEKTTSKWLFMIFRLLSH